MLLRPVGIVYSMPDSTANNLSLHTQWLDSLQDMAMLIHASCYELAESASKEIDFS